MDTNHYKIKVITLVKVLSYNLQFTYSIQPHLHFPKLLIWYNNFLVKLILISTNTFFTNTSSTISSLYLWFNAFIKIENSVVYYKEVKDNQINYVYDFFNTNSDLKSWMNIEHEYKIKKCILNGLSWYM